MRILHVYKDVFPPIVGGIERHIDSIRRALPELTHDVLACSRSGSLRIVREAYGKEVLVGEYGRRVLSTPISPSFPFWLRRLAPGAIVHLHSPNPLGELSVAVTGRRAPLVMSYHADIYRQRALLPLYRPLLRRCFTLATTVVAGSKHLADHSIILNAEGVFAKVVPYGIDTASWDPAGADPRAAAAIRAHFGGPHILAVGRLVAYKGFDRLIEAAASLSWPVAIVGDGPECQALQDLIAARRLRASVQLVGQVTDEQLRNHLAAADIFVLPSVNRAEAFGIALLEAQAAGLPVVASDTGSGTAEAMQPGKTGFLVPSGDVPALVAAINTLADSPKLRHQMGQDARRWVEREHSLAVMAKLLRPVYERAATQLR